MRVLVADKLEHEGLEGLAALGCEVTYEPDLKAEDLPAHMGDAEVLIVRSTRVTADAIAAGRSLRLIIRAGSGYDTIDVEAASARGVAVSNCPGMNAVAVAELAMGLLLACDRRIPEQVADWRAGRWNKGEYSKARGLKGRTLGVVGAGNIGRELIERARAFGMRCIVWSAHMTEARAADLGAGFGGTTRADLLAMLPRCDAVSLHVALSDETRGLCDAEFFAALPAGAIFINTARGGVVDEAALIEALRTRGLRCGLDVQAVQPAEKAGPWPSPLAALPGVCATHHVGASTEQAQTAVAEEVVRIVASLRDRGTPINVVNEPATARG